MEITLPKENSLISERRNAGIDLLRIIAAFYMIVLHILGFGGLLESCTLGTYQYVVCKMMLAWSYCAVNIFGVISGYVGYCEMEKPYRFRHWLNLWLEVVFYGVFFTLLTIWLRPETSGYRDLIAAFTPIIHNNHWYFTAYTGLFLLMPLLNGAVRNCSSKTLITFLALVFFLFIPLENATNVFYTMEGYSCLWLVMLYLIGAIMKKTGFAGTLSAAALLGIIVGTVLISYGINRWYFSVNICGITISSQIAENYVFPGHLVIAICYVLLFSRLKLGMWLQKAVLLVAPGAFAVYLMNTQRHVWNGYMADHFVPWSSSSPFGIVARVVATALVFTFVSLIVDMVRRKVFSLFRKKL